MLTPDPTPDKQMEHGSGWCITGYHDGCRYQFNHGKCGCECHTQTPKTQIAPVKRGRPKKESIQGMNVNLMIIDEISDKKNLHSSVGFTQETYTTSVSLDPRPWKR